MPPLLVKFLLWLPIPLLGLNFEHWLFSRRFSRQIGPLEAGGHWTRCRVGAFWLPVVWTLVRLRPASEALHWHSAALRMGVASPPPPVRVPGHPLPVAVPPRPAPRP